MRYWISLRAAGALLLFTAVLKMHAISTVRVEAVQTLLSPNAYLLLTQVELLLGVWFLLALTPVGAWAVAVLLFTLFAGVSLYQGMVGVSSCGCLGTTSVSPWIALAVDLAVVTALLVDRPAWADIRRSSLSQALACGLTALLIPLAATGAVSLWFGSLNAALAELRGTQVTVSPGQVDLGEGSPNEVRQFTVTLVNHTTAPVRVVGGLNNCSCKLTNDLPVTLAPAESREVTIAFRYYPGPGNFTHEATLLAEDPNSPALRGIPFSIAGRVASSP